MFNYGQTPKIVRGTAYGLQHSSVRGSGPLKDGVSLLVKVNGLGVSDFAWYPRILEYGVRVYGVYVYPYGSFPKFPAGATR